MAVTPNPSTIAALFAQARDYPLAPNTKDTTGAGTRPRYKKGN